MELNKKFLKIEKWRKKNSLYTKCLKNSVKNRIIFSKKISKKEKNSLKKRKKIFKKE